MSKIAFLFPGQGSQFAGMGKSLAEAFPVAAATFAEADEALGFKISELCWQGPEEELKKTTSVIRLKVTSRAISLLPSK